MVTSSTSQDSAPAPDSDSAHSRCEVLVVDDNPHVTKALTVLLSRAGFTPIPCHRGADALAQVAEPQAARRLCAAVVDIHLPDISGLILAQKLRDRIGPATPIVVVSGDTSMETINSLAHIGATYFFSKPVNSAALVERLKALTGGANPAER